VIAAGGWSGYIKKQDFMPNQYDYLSTSVAKALAEEYGQAKSIELYGMNGKLIGSIEGDKIQEFVRLLDKSYLSTTSEFEKGGGSVGRLALEYDSGKMDLYLGEYYINFTSISSGGGQQMIHTLCGQWYENQNYLILLMSERAQSITRLFITNPMDLTILNAKELKLYEDFKKGYDDEILRGADPITVTKLYLYATKIGDRETQYELYIDDTNSVAWTKEEHMAFPKESAKATEESLNHYRNVGVSIYYHPGDENSAALEINGGAPFTIGFGLTKNSKGIWKVNFLPAQ